jgi:hypothetical protein
VAAPTRMNSYQILCQVAVSDSPRTKPFVFWAECKTRPPFVLEPDGLGIRLAQVRQLGGQRYLHLDRLSSPKWVKLAKYVPLA